MKAWEAIYDNDCGDIIFLDDSKTKEELENTFEYIDVNRRPQYDKYFETGVPKKVLIDDGWWFECNECYRTIDENMYDFENVFYKNNEVYCCRNCYDVLQDRINQINFEYKQFQIVIQTEFSDFEIVGFDGGGYPSKTPIAYFDFPGRKYSFGQIKIVDKELRFFISNGDLDKFNKWNKNY